jgi:hypothetical protein
MPKVPEEVGDLFVTNTEISVKLFPSRKSKSRPIDWFPDGVVSDHGRAARDIQDLLSGLQNSRRVVRGLTVMTPLGSRCDLRKNGLHQAVEKAGFEILN